MQLRLHINLDVTDLEAAVNFYGAVFACPPTKRYDDYANFRLEEPALHLALVVQPRRAREGNQHFGIELFDISALAAWQSRIEAARLPMRIEQSITCCYAVADKFWLMDPDGHEWEFWVRSDEADSMHGPTQQSQEACCAPGSERTVALAEKTSCCG